MLRNTKAPKHFALRATALALASLLWMGLALADPPARVARLGYIEGDVSLSPAGAADWVQASLNQPLTTGDHLWIDSNARAELQLGGSAVRLGARSNLTVLNLDDSITQLQLSEGSLRLRVRSIGRQQRVEVDTPNLALVLSQAGDYRVDVDPDGNATTVRVQSGVADAYGDGASYRISANQAFRFYGTGLAELESLADEPDDALDRWALQRDRRLDSSSSARYVSGDVVGYEDLDANGSWRLDASYGNVWTPNRVASGWTPYRDGHWAWVDPWGWTWMDDAPWGYAVSHYGRWARIQNAWSWVPGPQREPAVYAPALVVFLGGDNFRAAGSSAGNVGWFPLAPREVYRPSYAVSRGYFERVNRSNAVIAPATITTIYNTQINNTKTTINSTKVVNVTKVVYANQQISGAVVAVPAQAFVQSRPVAKAVVTVAREQVRSAPAAAVTVVAEPQRARQRGGVPDAHSKPPQERQAVVVRTAPPAAPAVKGEPARAVHVLEPATAATPPAVPANLPPRAAKADERKPAAAATPAAGVKPDPADKVTEQNARPVPVDAANKLQAARAEGVKAEAMKAEAAKADAAKLEAAKAQTSKAQAAQTDAAKVEAAKAEAGRNAAAKEQALKAQAEQANAAKADAAKEQVGRNAVAKEQAAQTNAAKADAAKQQAGRNAAAKEQAAQANAARADAAKEQAGRNAAANEQAVQANAAKADAAREEQASRNAAAKEQAAQANATRAEAAKEQASRNAVAKEQAAQANAAREQARRENAAKNPAPAARPQGQGPRNPKAALTEEELLRAEEAARKH